MPTYDTYKKEKSEGRRAQRRGFFSEQHVRKTTWDERGRIMR